MLRKLLYGAVLTCLLAFLLPAGMASAITFGFDTMESESEMDNTISETKSGYTLVISSSITVDDYVTNCYMDSNSGEVMLGFNPVYMNDYVVAMAYLDWATMLAYKPKGTITVRLADGKYFSVESFVCGKGSFVDDHATDTLSLKTGSVTEDFTLSKGNTVVVTPSSAFHGITSFTLSWNDDVQLLFDNFNISLSPAIKTQPSSRSIKSGENTSFGVTAIGNSVTYQWQVDTSGTGTGYTNISNGGVYSGATTSTLSITGATAAMNNNLYRCNVTGEGIHTSSSNYASLSVITEAPTNLSLDSSSIQENSAVGTKVGGLSTTDADSTVFTYSLVDTAFYPDNEAFTISGSDLLLNTVPDFEVKSGYTIRIRTEDEAGGSFVKEFVISIADVNEAPTDLTLSNATLPENSALGTTIGTLSGIDQDADSSLSYTLVPGAGATDNDSFTIAGNELKINTDTDYEVKSSYSVRIQVSDGALSYEKSFTISVTDINEAPTDLDLSECSVLEHSEAGTVIGTFSAIDPDTGATLTYSLVSGTGDDDNGSFLIDGNELKLGIVPDFEVKDSYSIRVAVSDGTLTEERSFIITIIDGSDPPVIIGIASAAIYENDPPGSNAGTITIDDHGDEITLSLVAGDGDTDNASFYIDGRHLRSNITADYETKNTFSVRVRATSHVGLYDEMAFTIQVIDVNEAPTDINLSSSEVEENSAVGTVIGTLTGDDPDAGSSFIYGLVSGAGDTDNASFTIDGDELKLAIVPDYETKSSYSIRIGISDGALSYEKQFTITITDGDEPPTDITLSESSIAENTAVGTAVATLSASDEDSSSFTYTLVAGAGSTDNASFTITGNELKLATVPDYETKASYQIRIRVTDDSGLYYEKQFTITVEDVNEAPTDISLSETEAAENSAVGTTIGTLSGTDPDAGSTFTYTLVSGAGDTDNASFVINGTDLESAEVFDYESKASYEIRIRVTDNDGLTYEKQFTISVGDVNEAPTGISLSNSAVTENTSVGTTVGTLTGTDPDAGSSFTFTLVSGAGDTDNGSFTITGNELKLALVPDYEAKSSYTIRVRVSDGALSHEEQFTITVEDVNEAPTDISLSETEIAENTAAGTTIGTLSGTDQDAGDSLTYTLVSGSGDTDNASFTISGTALKNAEAFDYETKNTYAVRIRVTDHNGLFYEKQFTITVGNVNEAPTDVSLSSSEVAENSAVGTTIGILSGTDPDTGSSFTYTLVSGAGDTDNASFTIEGNELKLAIVPDYETKAIYSIRVSVSDGALSYEKQFTITITDGDEPPTDITLSESSIAENTAVGTRVASLSASDEDSSSFTYTLVAGAGSTDNASFTITGNELKLATVPDYETKASYQIRIRVTDDSGLYYEKQFTITVEDVNEAPTDISLSETEIAENTAAGTTIGTLSGTDQDAGDSLTYTLVSGAGDTDNASFVINGTDLESAEVFDYESKASYEIRIRVTDNDGLTYEKQFTISVGDVNEAPTGISLSNSEVTENTAVGTTIGTLTGTDPDAGSSFTFTLVSGEGDTDNGSFTITGNELKLALVPDYEAKSSYTIRVRVSDGALSYEEQFTITVEDVNEAPTDISLSETEAAENSAVGTTIGTLSGTDQDAGDSLTYTLVSGSGATDNASFTISGAALKNAEAFDYETKNTYAVRIRVTDHNGLFYEKQFTITVGNVNEAPTDVSLSSSEVAENSAVGTTIGILSGTDPDTGSSFTYTLVSGAGDTDNASFTIEGDELKLAIVPDYETKSSYSIRIGISDGALSYEKQFTITITDGDEPPTDITLSESSIAENTAVGTAVATLSASDEDSSSFTYTLVAGAGSTDNASFTITGNELKLATVPDYETKASYQIRIRVTDDSGLYYEKQFTITVGNVNEAPTDISLSNSEVAENSAVGTTIGTLSGTDPDAGSTCTYTLVSGAGDTDNGSFTITDNELKLALVPNYEAKASYTIRVRVSDGTLSYEKQFTITITDSDEQPTDITLSYSSIAENTAVGTTIGTLSASDDDSGSSFTYTLVSGAGSDDNAGFTIEGNVLKLAVVPDYEAKASYHIRIRVTDNNDLSYEEQFTITVVDVNEAPTDISLSETEIAENTAAGTTIGTLSGTDQDAGDSLTYTLVSGSGATDNASFTISGAALKNAEAFDYETKNTYAVRIRVTDHNGLFYEKQFTITVGNVNEAPTDVSLSSSEVAENSAVGTTIGILSGTDPDTGSSFTYTLVSGAGDTDNASFTIEGNELKLAIVPDYETKASYSIRVSVSDGALSYEKQYTITITDGDEPPTDITLSESSMAENTAVGTAVAALSASDEDSSSFTYTLVAGAGSTDNTSFLITGNELKLAAVPDYETKASYQIRIRATDNGGQSFEKQFDIAVTDINEAPSDITITNATIAENSDIGTIIGTLTGVDEDRDDTLAFAMATGEGDEDNRSFTLAGNVLKSAADYNYEQRNAYSIRLRVTDASGLYYEKSITISITDVDEDTPPQPKEPVVEKLMLDVTDGNKDNSVAKVEVERTYYPEGTIKDSITFSQEKAAETIEKLTQEKGEIVRLVAPVAEEKVSEVDVSIPVKSVGLIADAGLNLELETEDALISIPTASLETAKEQMEEDLYFRIKPVTDEEKKQNLTERATKDGMLVQLLGDNLSVIGSPMEIETNLPQTSVDIVLPLVGITIPDDEKEREELISKLAIYVEHSDGDKETIKGELVKNKDGSYGLKFTVTKFSIFTILKDVNLKSNLCRILTMKTPDEANIDGYFIRSNLPYETTKIKLNFTVSKNATWKLYSNKACTKEIKNNFKLEVGLNKVYIKVTAEDGVSYQIYTLYLIRSKAK